MDLAYVVAMNRLPRLKNTLRNIVFATIPLAVMAHSNSTIASEEPVEVSIAIHPDGAFGGALAACLNDQAACQELCHEVLVTHELIGPDESVVFGRCEALPEGDLYNVDMEYSAYEYPAVSGCGVVPVRKISGAKSLGVHFAAVTALETESIVSFVRLARELQHHGAPAELVDGALSAASDELQHARMADTLAQSLGGKRRTLNLTGLAVRGVFSICQEHSKMACVNEAFGAMVATWQARTAKDPVVTHVMKTISEDELRHAELAYRVAAWLRSQLTPSEQGDIEQATRLATEELAQRLTDPPRELIERAGYPTVEESRTLLNALEAERRRAFNSEFI